MDELFAVEIARRMWEAMNPGGCPWNCIPNDEIKERMIAEMRQLMIEMDIPPDVSKEHVRGLMPQPEQCYRATENLQRLDGLEIRIGPHHTLELTHFCECGAEVLLGQSGSARHLKTIWRLIELVLSKGIVCIQCDRGYRLSLPLARA